MRRIITFPLPIRIRIGLQEAKLSVYRRSKPRKKVVAAVKRRRTMVDPTLLRNYNINKYKGQCPF
jgi:hypothetical protein